MKTRTTFSLLVACLGGFALASVGDDFQPFAAAARTLKAQAAASGRLTTAGAPILAGGVLVTNAADTPVVGLFAMDDLSGAIAWGNSAGVATAAGIKGLAGVFPDASGFLAVRNTANTTSFVLSGNSGLVTVAGDMAEAFPSESGGIEPGSVMVIDPARPGALRLARQPYDRRVAGVVAGAKDNRPGITLRGLAHLPDGLPITLSGTVYCLATNANGPIRGGDLLTTSAVPGHAMRATDAEAARGAILGKSMQDLPGERGHILILASLQ